MRSCSYFTIKNLTGFKVHGNMYCSKDCFVMKNVLTSKYQVFEYDYIKSNQRRDEFNISPKR
jgi:hypothetical protein